MIDTPAQLEQMARDVRLAYELGDLGLFAALLAPNVTWGPPGEPPTCRSKSQVLTWYQNGANAGARAEVQEIEIIGDQLLVGLSVIGAPAAMKQSGRTVRWQVLTVNAARIINIVGFETKSEARAWASH